MPLASLFSTPVALYEHDDLGDMNQELTRILVAESKSVASVAHSNVGGWHSPYNLQSRQEPCFRKLTELVVGNAWRTGDAIAQTTGRRLPQMACNIVMWAMVMRDGNYSSPHTHANSHWAVVYYPDAGDVDSGTHKKSGDIGFLDPRSAMLPIPGLDMTVGEFLVKPKTGQMLVFPGWLMHFVHAYHGSRPRVSIACNVTFQVDG
jgi:uncharacterized protein (TIGR02466 family)